MVNKKYLAFALLLTLLSGALYATATTTVVLSQSGTVIDFIGSLFSTTIALCDPVPGGGGSGGFG